MLVYRGSLLIVTVCLITGIVGMQGLYRIRFEIELRRLEGDVELAHSEPMSFSYLRFSRRSQTLCADFWTDVFEGVRARLPQSLEKGGRLSTYSTADRLTTAFAYYGVDVSHDVAGEQRSTHFFIWSPRRGRFFLWDGHCGHPGCPASQ